MKHLKMSAGRPGTKSDQKPDGPTRGTSRLGNAMWKMALYGSMAVGVVLLHRWLRGAVCTEVADLTGKIVIVTGATDGIGVETAKALYAMGATVVIPCRNMKKGEKVLSVIQSQVISSGKIELMPMDLSSLSSVVKFADSFTAKYKKLHILINNAGVQPPVYRETADGLQDIFQVNHLANHLLVGLLLPSMKAAGEVQRPARVVTLASGLHYRGKLQWDHIEAGRMTSSANYKQFQGYSDSKLLNVVFAAELQRCVFFHPRRRCFAFAVFPEMGGSNTVRVCSSSLRVPSR
jgi:NAD(P)-dependent dehydrogenase (short-subunit alcohol dehydrogenase family)